jgi:hypothetical protein
MVLTGAVEWSFPPRLQAGLSQEKRARLPLTNNTVSLTVVLEALATAEL